MDRSGNPKDPPLGIDARIEGLEFKQFRNVHRRPLDLQVDVLVRIDPEDFGLDDQVKSLLPRKVDVDVCIRNLQELVEVGVELSEVPNRLLRTVVGIQVEEEGHPDFLARLGRRFLIHLDGLEAPVILGRLQKLILDLIDPHPLPLSEALSGTVNVHVDKGFPEAH